MKRAILVGVILSLMLGGTALAGPISIEVISQTCRVWGDVWNEGEPYRWDESGTTRVEVTDPTYGWLGSATALVGQFSAFVAVELPNTEHAGALAELVFRPVGASALAINAQTFVSAWWSHVVLMDLSANTELLLIEVNTIRVNGQELPVPSPWPSQLSYGGVFPVDPSHVYRLTAEGFGEYAPSSAQAGMVLLSAPDPGSTLLLLGISLVGLGAWRKRLG